MLRLISALILIVGLSACVTRTLTTDATFDPNDGAWIKESGPHTISGQAFLRRNDGIVVYAAGSPVEIFPATNFSKERVEKIFNGRKSLDVYQATSYKFENTPDGYLELSRETKADGEGKFTFDNVANGEYFIRTTVFWKAGDASQGGMLVEKVSVKDGNVNVIMNGL